MQSYTVLVLVLVHLLLQSASSGIRNNVCMNLVNYSTKLVNPNCWFNPDVWSSTDAIIARHGYPVETYKVTTEDGYILTTFRIPHDGSDTNKTRPPVYIQHGATLDSNCWALIGNNSLPFRLVDFGFDVFLGNTRGTKYSSEHEKYRRNSKEYWQYSLDETARYDISAQLDFISQKVNSKKILYIGHSMGGTLGVFHGIVKREQAERLLSGYIFLAPAVYLIKYKLLAIFLFGFAPVIKALADVFQIYALFQYQSLHRLMFNVLCTGTTAQYEFCQLLTFLFFGFSDEQLQAKDLPVWLSHWPEGISGNTLYHYAEIARSGEVKMYDFGEFKNEEVYGQSVPPFYNLSDITLPVHIFHTAKDPLVTPESLQPFYEQLGSNNKSIQLIPPKSSGVEFAHLDFLYAKDVEQYFYKPLFELLSAYLVS